MRFIWSKFETFPRDKKGLHSFERYVQLLTSKLIAE